MSVLPAEDAVLEIDADTVGVKPDNPIRHCQSTCEEFFSHDESRTIAFVGPILV